AHEQFPTDALVLSSLVRVLVKQDSDPFEIGVLLDQLILHDDRQEWIEWAKELRMTRYALDCDGCVDGYTALPPEALLAEPQAEGSPVDQDTPSPGRLMDDLMEFDSIEEMPPPATWSAEPRESEARDLELLIPQAGKNTSSSVRQVSYAQQGDRPKRLPAFSQRHGLKSKTITFNAAADSILKAMK
ncbi:MAG: hypothetical protein AAGJ83_13005, partial [Planctomycetota bacterium]